MDILNDPEVSESLVKELLPFKNSFRELPSSYLFSMFLQQIRDFMLLMASIVGPVLTNTSGYIFLNMRADPLLQAAFGLYSFIYFAFHMSIMISGMEKLGIHLSAAFGRKDYAQMKNTFTKGIISSTVLFCLVTLPVALFCQSILVSAGVDKENCVLVQEALYWSIPLFILMICKELIQTFCMAQGHEHFFGTMGIVSSVIAILLNYILIVRYDCGVLGWVYSRSFCSTGELLFVLCIFYWKTDEGGRGVVTISQAIAGFKPFFIDSIKFTLGSYTEYLGFEIAGFFVLLHGDNNQSAAYYSAVNVSALTYTSGIAFGIIIRTRINMLMGMGLPQTARNYFEFYFISTVIAGTVIGIIGLLNRKLLADCYASANDELRRWFLTLVVLYAVTAPSEASACSALVALKTVGGIGHLLKLSVCTLLLGNSISGPMFLYFKIDVTYIFGFTMFLTVLYNVLVLKKVLETDWNAVEFDDGAADGNDSIEALLADQIRTRHNIITPRNRSTTPRSITFSPRKITRMPQNIANF